MVLKPHHDFEKHNRPVLEELTQIQGNSVIRLFEKERLVKEVTLDEGDRIGISAGQFHIHSNPYDQTSVTMWKFEEI